MNVKNNNGFTLSELMLGAMILVFCLTSILSLFLSSSLLSQSSQDLTQLATHCQFIMEEIKDTPFGQIASKVNNGDWDLTTAQLNASPYNFPVLPGETVNTSIFQAGIPLGVAVRINYMLQGRRNQTYELRTLFTE